MSLSAGQKMVRVDDGMQGVVELTAMPGFDQHQELRIVYQDRGERRIAGKREKWEPEAPPARKLRRDEIDTVARMADEMLRTLEGNKPMKWWQWGHFSAEPCHDRELVKLITEYLQKRA